MRAQDIDEATVLCLARLAQIELRPEQVAAVVANLQHTAGLAAPLMDLALDVEDELAPVWRP